MLKIGMVQQACTTDIEQNKQRMAAGVRECVAKGAQLVVLQELHNSLYFCQVENVDNFDIEVGTWHQYV